MAIKESLMYQSNGIVEMLSRQSILPYLKCTGVDELLREYPYSVTREMATFLFLLGYIEGKRVERAKRKK